LSTERPFQVGLVALALEVTLAAVDGRTKTLLGRPQRARLQADGAQGVVS
jgi:hypothetical protein